VKPRARARAGGESRRGLAIKEPPVLFERTQTVVSAIEKELGATFLAYWNSPNGSVCQNDVNGFYGVLRSLGPQERVMIFLKSDGGTATAALRIVHLLREHAKSLCALVPLECASAATMIALGADELLIGPMGYLTAVDTSLTHDLSPLDRDNSRVSVSQDELTRAIRLWHRDNKGDGSNPYPALFPYVHPLVVGAVDRSSSLSTKLCEEILSYHMADAGSVQEISRALNADYPSHGYPITIKEARRLGLRVDRLPAKINSLLLELNEQYSEMGQRAITDYDEENHHDNEILNIIEGKGLQIFYQTDKDWHYRKEERRWVSMNDKSSWRKAEVAGGKTRVSVFHIR